MSSIAEQIIARNVAQKAAQHALQAYADWMPGMSIHLTELMQKQMVKDRVSIKDQSKTYAALVYDGLAYGNWPKQP